MYLNWEDLKKESYNLFYFPSFYNLRLEWNLGFILIFFYSLQAVTGVFIILFFKIGLQDCLKSKSFIIKEIELGWIVSYYHCVIPSFLFLCLFFHIFKSLYNSVFLYSNIWISGFFILLLLILISFTGYGLVGGSLGFWAIIVFMGIVESIFGEFISFLLLSDFGALSDLILYKVFCYHTILAIGMMLSIFFHLYTVHILGSSLGIYSIFVDFYFFHITCYLKDLLLEVLVFLYFLIITGERLEYFFSLENFLILSIYVVPEEINSEWYLRPVFILLRCVNRKWLGIFYSFLTLTGLGINFFLKNLLGEGLFGKICNYLLVFSNWLLIVFTLSKFGGSFYVTSGVLLTLFFLVSYFLIFYVKIKLFFNF